jgi:hypothetical protein
MKGEVLVVPWGGLLVWLGLQLLGYGRRYCRICHPVKLFCRIVDRYTGIYIRTHGKIYFHQDSRSGTSGNTWFMSFSLSKSELRTCQLVEIWLNPDERCYEHEEKKVSYGVENKGIRQELSRNIWTIKFILPLVILNVLRRTWCVDYRKQSA